MPYTLSRLAPGSYDVMLDGVIIASLVRSGETNDATWTAELLENVHPRRRPAPFTETEHTFRSLEEAEVWLGIIDGEGYEGRRHGGQRTSSRRRAGVKGVYPLTTASPHLPLAVAGGMRLRPSRPCNGLAPIRESGYEGLGQPPQEWPIARLSAAAAR
jgi:hypothetical protein